MQAHHNEKMKELVYPPPNNVRYRLICLLHYDKAIHWLKKKW